ncbi:MAG: site-2 protease family protein [ANME-2 cluster archaeon]|nr:site-2 protease family protein [ANME-2 cluster archaeon]
MKWSLQIGKVIGIPIRLHVTFLFILILFIYYFAIIDFQIGTLVLGFNGMNISLMEKLIFSTIASILFFSTILLHELSHSFVAKRSGLNIQSITLFVFGGVAQMEEIPRNPKLELKMAAAGPALSLAIGLMTYALYVYFGPVEVDGIGMTAKNAVLITAGIISVYNLVLGIFNLLPAFPMDGGRVLRAFLAMWLPYMDATRMAVSIGKTFALLMGIFGLLTVNIMLILIAVFVFYGAQGEERETFFAISLEGIKVKDVMTPVQDLIFVPPGWTISQLVEAMFRFKHMGYPVQDGLDRPPLGIVTFEDVQKVPKQQHDTVQVKDIMTGNIISVTPETEAYQALQTIAKHNIGRLLVIKDGRLNGIITMKDIMRNMQFKHMYPSPE